MAKQKSLGKGRQPEPGCVHAANFDRNTEPELSQFIV